MSESPQAPEKHTHMTFEKGRRILLAQMLPHTCIGHPIAQMLTLIGFQKLADAVHYRTLPNRARRKMKSVTFNPDPRLRYMDLIFTPICSIARAFGRYELADRIFRLGPHEIATQLGACGYYYKSSKEFIQETANQHEKQRIEEVASSKLKQAGYVALTVRTVGTSKYHPWVWDVPSGHKPTKTEMGWIAASGHNLKPQYDPTVEYERID